LHMLPSGSKRNIQETLATSKKKNQRRSMKRNIIFIISFIAFISAFVLSGISFPRFDFKLILFTLIIIVFGGLITSLTIAVWSKQNRKKSFLKNLPISFGLNSIIFISGYLFTSLQPLI